MRETDSVFESVAVGKKEIVDDCVALDDDSVPTDCANESVNETDWVIASVPLETVKACVSVSDQPIVRVPRLLLVDAESTLVFDTDATALKVNVDEADLTNVAVSNADLVSVRMSEGVGAETLESVKTAVSDCVFVSVNTTDREADSVNADGEVEAVCTSVLEGVRGTAIEVKDAVGMPVTDTTRLFESVAPSADIVEADCVSVASPLCVCVMVRSVLLWTLSDTVAVIDWLMLLLSLCETSRSVAVFIVRVAVSGL